MFCEPDRQPIGQAVWHCHRADRIVGRVGPLGHCEEMAHCLVHIKRQ